MNVYFIAPFLPSVSQKGVQNACAIAKKLKRLTDILIGNLRPTGHAFRVKQIINLFKPSLFTITIHLD